MAAVKQVSTITIGGTVAIGDVITIKAGFGALAITMAAAGTAAAAAQIQAALSATGIPAELAECAYTVAGSVITATAKVAGVPITFTGSATGSGTVTVATPTAATGPNFVNVAENWSGSTLPTTGDDISIESGPSLLYGLTTITQVMASVTIEAEFNGTIGLPETNVSGYPEYRVQHWSINTAKLSIGQGAGRASSRIKLNLGTQATAITIEKTGAQFGDEQPVQIIGGVNATAFVLGGAVAFAPRATEVCTFTSVVIGDGASVLFGSGVTHGTIDSSGEILVCSSVTTLRVHGGTTTLQAAATTIVIDGGTLAYQSAATLPSVTVGPGTLDLSDVRPRTISSLTIKRNATVRDPKKTATLTDVIIATDALAIATQG